MSSAREFDKRKQLPWSQEGAPRGMVKNAPHEDIPEGSVAYLRNAHAFPTEFQPRQATRVHSSIAPPALTGRTGYSATKSGDRIYSQSGDIFNADDVGNLFAWPGDPRRHDEIQEYISPTQVRVRDSGTETLTTGCYVHAKLNLFRFHKTQRKFVFQWGEDVYIADNLNISSWTKALLVSAEGPANALSDSDEMDDYLVIFNSAGHFLVDMSRSPALVFRKNTGVPGVLIESNTKTDSLKHRYDYLYSMSRLNGEGIRNRGSDGVLILQESGTVALNVNTNPPRDYGTVWTEKRIDDTVKTQGRLVGGTVAAANQTPTYWQGLTAATSAVIGLSVNGRTENLVIDFGPAGYNVQSMVDVASAIQVTMRAIWPLATCEYTSSDVFVITSGVQDGSTVGYAIDGVGAGYTNIAGIMLLRIGDGAVVDNNYAYTQTQSVGVFTVPAVGSAPTTRERHWTHFSVWRSEDLSEYGIDPRMDEDTNELLPPLKFTWVNDVRIGGAFYASRDIAGLVTAQEGTFEVGDVGTPFEWQDGEVDTIYRYVSPTQVYTTPGNEDADYYDVPKPLQAAAIGGGRVINASQTGNRVTRTGGSAFTAADVGKTLTWSTGQYSIITSFVDANTVIVDDSRDKGVQGVTLDSTDRVINDNVSDAKLRDRQGEPNIGLLDHRFWVAMPNVNIGTVVPGFMVTAVRGSSDIYYCQLPTGGKFLSSYYLEVRQKMDRVEGAVQTIKKLPNKFVVFCNASTWAGPTNIPDIKTLPEFGEAYAILHVDILDERIGVIDIGSIQEIDFGVFQMRCNDGGWRQFTEYGFNRELGDMAVDKSTGQDKVRKDLGECWGLGTSIYGKTIGHIWWGKRKS